MRKLLRLALVAAFGIGLAACTASQPAPLVPRIGSSGHATHVQDSGGGIIPGCDPTVTTCGTPGP
jgi:hypothetical protein